MLRISGPELISHIVFKHKNILIFGDEHYDTLGKCYSCKKDCLTISSFFKKLHSSSDIFIETPWKNKKDKQNYKKIKKNKNDDILIGLKKTFFLPLYKHKPVIIGKRFHFTDIRHESHISWLEDVGYIQFKKLKDRKSIDYLNTVSFLFPTPIHFVTFVYACVRSDNFIQSIHTLFGSENGEIFLDRNELTNIPGTKTRTIHRIRKQILKLPKSQQELVLKYCSDTMKQIVRVFINFLKSSENKDKTYVFAPDFALLLMDVYHISRMLYYFNISRDIKNHTLLSYTGSYHSHNYIRFFTKYLKGKQVYINDKSFQSDDESQKRCIDLPLKTAEQILNF